MSYLEFSFGIFIPHLSHKSSPIIMIVIFFMKGTAAGYDEVWLEKPRNALLIIGSTDRSGI